MLAHRQFFETKLNTTLRKLRLDVPESVYPHVVTIQLCLMPEAGSPHNHLNWIRLRQAVRYLFGRGDNGDRVEGGTKFPGGIQSQVLRNE